MIGFGVYVWGAITSSLVFYDSTRGVDLGLAIVVIFWPVTLPAAVLNRIIHG